MKKYLFIGLMFFGGVAHATDITDPEVIKFANEQIRPLAEEIRAIKARLAAMQIKWEGGISSKVPNDGSILLDGRASQGVSVLTGSDINQEVGNMIGTAEEVNDQIIEKPCVRPLSAQ